MLGLFKKKKDSTQKAVEKTTTIPPREGLFAEVWELFKFTSGPSFFDEGITLTECIFREEDGMIDLFVARNGQTICFNIDSESVFMSDDDSDADETVELTEFADLEELRVRMNHFVVTHTRSTLS